MVSHVVGHFVICSVGCLGCNLLESGFQNKILVGMNEIGTIVIEYKAVRFFLKFLFKTLMVLGVNTLVAQSEPLHLITILIVNVCHISGGKLLRCSLIEVRRCPIAFIAFISCLVPGVRQEIGMNLVHLLTLDNAVRIAPGIYLEVVSTLWVEVGFKYQATARHVFVKLYHLLQMCLQLVGIVEIVLNHTSAIDGCHIHVGQHTTYFLVGVQHNTLVTRFNLACGRVTCNDKYKAHNGGPHD